MFILWQESVCRPYWCCRLLFVSGSCVIIIRTITGMLEPSGMTFEAFKEKRALKPTKEYKRHTYRTPSGKIEIYCERLRKMGYSPIPSWEEVSKVHEISDEYPLLLTNAKEEAYMLSGFKSVASIRMIRPDPAVEMNPETALKLGLKEGEWVYIETPQGKIEQRLFLNRDLDPRVIMGAFGWWFPEKSGDEYGWRNSNINVLIKAGPEFDPSTGGITLRGIPCRVYGADDAKTREHKW